jgi:VWFA-related protein
VVTATIWWASVVLAAQEPVATFRSGVDLVRVSAVVRDDEGRFVRNLARADFEVLDDGRPRDITDFRQDSTGISVALLLDTSGSMEHTLPEAREAVTHVLSWLEARDEAAIFTFDTGLAQITPFTSGMKALPESVQKLTPFGATSLHDAIARVAARVGERDGRRRAVVVFTDGRDNASRMAPAEVSAIASSIDVPVYLFAAVPSIDNPSSGFVKGGEGASLSGSLADLATWTGGHVFVASTPGARSASAKQIADELRHQYLIAFESSGKPGWHPLVVRTRDKDLIVRARSGYIAGQSRPSSH